MCLSGIGQCRRVQKTRGPSMPAWSSPLRRLVIPQFLFIRRALPPASAAREGPIPSVPRGLGVSLGETVPRFPLPGTHGQWPAPLAPDAARLRIGCRRGFVVQFPTRQTTCRPGRFKGRKSGFTPGPCHEGGRMAKPRGDTVPRCAMGTIYWSSKYTYIFMYSLQQQREQHQKL